MSILRYPGVFGFYCPDVLDQVDHRSALAQTSAAPSATLAVLDQAPCRCRRSWRRSGWNFSSWNMLGILCPKLSLIVPNSSYVKRLQEITGYEFYSGNKSRGVSYKVSTSSPVSPSVTLNVCRSCSHVIQHAGPLNPPHVPAPCPQVRP
jgi:hypothetical protein